MVRSVKALFRGSSAPAVAVFVAAALAGTAQAATLAIGPIEQVNVKNSTVVVLGQTYKVSPAAVLKNQAGRPFTLSSLAPYTLVEVDGSESASGAPSVSSITRLRETDVPGATQLLVTGFTSSESATGQVKIGSLVVDVTSTLTSGSQAFKAGGLVQVTGTQPNPGGIFLAQNIISVKSSQALGIAGSGLSSKASLGIAGSGLSSSASLGIAGSGLSSSASLGIAGSGLSSKASLGIAGSGK
jgi:hypothetical protein